MDNFLNRLAPRPSDYGGLPGKITREDDAGNVYDETGRRIFNKFDQTEQPDSWLDTAISTATAPAKLATGLVGSLNPYGQDGWQVPPIISEPAAAFARSGELTGFGEDGQFYLPNVQNPQVAQDTLTQLMTVYGGNALGAALKPKPLQNALVPDGPTFYHGTDRAFSGNFSLEPARQSGEPDIALAFSSNPALASGYSGIHSSTRRWQDIGTDGVELSYYGNQAPRVYPVKIDAKNPKIIEQEDWGSRGENGDLMAEAKKQGHDAIFFRYTNPVYGDSGLQEALVWQPGTVRSATTGETLFSDNRPSLMGSALASMQDNALPIDQAITGWHGSRHDFDKFSMDKIGTGTGFAWDGYGLNFSDYRPTAEAYRDMTDGAYLYQAELPSGPYLDYELPLNQHPPEVQAAITDLLSAQKDSPDFAAISDPSLPAGNHYGAIAWNDKLDQRKLNEELAKRGVVGRVVDNPDQPGSRNYTLFQEPTIAHKWRGDEQLYSDNKPSLLGSALASGQGGAAPASIRAYHGMDGPVVGDAFNGPSFWATDRPATASRYAEGLHRGQQFEATAPNVLPVDMTGKIYDATGLENKIGVFDVARKNAREAGADIIKHLGGNYEAINRGTVRSATTGETLFSDNRPSIFGSALASAQSEEDIIRLLGIR